METTTLAMASSSELVAGPRGGICTNTRLISETLQVDPQQGAGLRHVTPSGQGEPPLGSWSVFPPCLIHSPFSSSSSWLFLPLPVCAAVKTGAYPRRTTPLLCDLADSSLDQTETPPNGTALRGTWKRPARSHIVLM